MKTAARRIKMAELQKEIDVLQKEIDVLQEEINQKQKALIKVRKNEWKNGWAKELLEEGLKLEDEMNNSKPIIIKTEVTVDATIGYNDQKCKDVMTYFSSTHPIEESFYPDWENVKFSFKKATKISKESSKEIHKFVEYLNKNDFCEEIIKIFPPAVKENFAILKKQLKKLNLDMDTKLSIQTIKKWIEVAEGINQNLPFQETVTLVVPLEIFINFDDFFSFDDFFNCSFVDKISVSSTGGNLNKKQRLFINSYLEGEMLAYLEGEMLDYITVKNLVSKPPALFVKIQDFKEKVNKSCKEHGLQTSEFFCKLYG